MQEALGLLEEAVKLFFGTLRVNGDGTGKPKAEDLHKALSVHDAKSIG